MSVGRGDRRLEAIEYSRMEVTLMREEGQEASAKKPYQKPEIRRVKLEITEATLGTGCASPVTANEIGYCALPGASCVVT